MTDSEQTVRGIYAALASGDVAALMGVFSEELVWNEAEGFPYADGNPYEGPTAVAMGVFGRLATEWEDFKVEIGEVVGGPDVVTVFGRYRGTYVANGKPLDVQCAHTWWLDGGKVVRFQQMVDTQGVAAVVSDSGA